MFCEFCCTDPRDKIYALANMPSAEMDLHFGLDYGKSVCEAYCEIAQSLTKHYNDLSILCLWHSNPGVSLHGLPSWVPDWGQEPKSALFFDPLIDDEGRRAPRQITTDDPFYLSSYERENMSIPQWLQHKARKLTGLLPHPASTLYSM
jgi:hypothetical protein